MEFRKVLLVASVLGLAAFAQACGGNACESSAEEVKAKYEECGFDLTVEDGGEDGGDTECSDAAGVLAECQSGCITAAPCGALDASDVDAATELGTCLADCSAA